MSTYTPRHFLSITWFSGMHFLEKDGNHNLPIRNAFVHIFFFRDLGFFSKQRVVSPLEAEDVAFILC